MKIVEREIKDTKGCDERRHVSCLTSPVVSRLTSHAPTPWPKVKLGEIADLDLGKMLDQKKNKGTPRHYLANIDVRWGYFNLGNLKEMLFKDSELERYGLRYGDIVMCEGGEPGRCAIWKEQRLGVMYQKALHRIRPHEGIDFRFLYYYFLLLGRKNGFAGLFTGSTIKHMPKDKLALVEIPLPPLPVQRRIADVLSAYDDLIENNRRRIAILEETARLAYRKWFGGVEQSWVAKLGKVSDFFDVSIGRTPPRKNEECFSTESTDLKWLSIKDMRASRVFVLDTAEKLTKAGIEKTHIHVSPPGTIFLSFKLTVGEVVIAGDSMATNEAIAHFETNDRALRDYTYFYLSSFQYDKLGSTSAIARAINSDIVRKMDFVFPARNVLERFGKDVAPMFDQIENLTRQNVALATARDMLLPRLMNNKLRKEA